MTYLRRFLAILLAFVSATPALAAPALWKVTQGDTTIYLFGTIHALPADHLWRGPVLEKAIASADTLVIEATMDADRTAITRLLPPPDPKLPPIVDRVPAKDRVALAKMLADAGFKPDQLDRMPTWQASLMIMGAMMRGLNLDPSVGVEKALTTSFATPPKKIEGLETLSQQIRYFAEFSEADQRDLLAGLADSAADIKALYAQMVAAWTSGDQKALSKALEDMNGLSPHVRDVLLIQRDADWARWVKERLNHPGTVMLAVGAGHLAGRESVLTMLAAEGIKVERIQ
jgi:uncharacterized protein YbaP (TraB family)